jgi:hypothetical protein
VELPPPASTMSFASSFRPHAFPRMGRPQAPPSLSMPALALEYSRYVPPSPTPSDEGEMGEFGPIRVMSVSAPNRVAFTRVSRT